MAETRMVRALTSFGVAMPKSKKGVGTPYEVIHEGDVVSASHPVVKQHPHLFGPLDGQVEQATAAPGEKRAAAPPKSKDTPESEES